MNRTSFLGIDLTSSPRKRSACVGLASDLDLVFAGSLRHDTDMLAAAICERPRLVAIDAPLSLPEGLCCLEERCGCEPSRLNGRECERTLAGLGIPCYFTTKRSIIKQMVYRGIALKSLLAEREIEVIEVYPYATKVRLWGKPIPRKGRREGLDFMQTKLVDVMPSLAPYVAGFDHDLCDAALAAYTACLQAEGRAEAVGSPGEGLIWIPARGG